MNKFLRKIFFYEEGKKPYSFEITNSTIANNTDFNQEIVNDLPNQKVSDNLKDNLTFLKVKYNALINSDFIIRDFIITFNGKKHAAAIVGIDGMVNSNMINDFLLRPLMGLSNKSKSIKLNNNIKVKKNLNYSLEDYLFNKLIPQNSINKENDFEIIMSAINMGNCLLFVDTLSTAFNIDVKGFQSRTISAPKNEIVVRGSQEAFVEKIRDNTAILRRLINNENLIIENTSVGTLSRTSIAICYMQNIANNSLVNEVKYRINNLDIDYIISSGQLEQLIQDNSNIAFPQLIATERPDKAANHLLEGRVVVLVNGSPFSLIMPAVFVDFLSSPEDFNLKHQYSNLLRFIRIIASLITLLLPRYLCCYFNIPCRTNSNRITIYYCCCKKCCTISCYI